METNVVVGACPWATYFKPAPIAPFNREALYQSAWNIADPGWRLHQEYISVVRALISMNQQVTLLFEPNPYEEELSSASISYTWPELIHAGRPIESFSAFQDIKKYVSDIRVSSLFDGKLACWPRDMVCVLSSDSYLVNPMVSSSIPPFSSHAVRSVYGEGGCLLVRKGRALVFDTLQILIRTIPIGIRPPVEDLSRYGLRVGSIPTTANIRLDQPLPTSERWIFEHHIDRTNFLFEDKKGEIHLLIDKTSQALIGRGHLLSIQETLVQYKYICDPLQITVHPCEIEVPGELCAIQLPDGQVLMTGGAEESAEIVADLVGEDKLTQTEIPIVVLPIFRGGGIHCLVTELPTDFLHTISMPYVGLTL